MKIVVQIEHRASSSRSEHEGESSFGLCDRLSRTRDNSQRQLPTDQDYAVSTREYQTDQSSLKFAPTAARSILEIRRKQRQHKTHRVHRLTRSLPIRPSHSLRLGYARLSGLLPINAEVFSYRALFRCETTDQLSPPGFAVSTHLELALLDQEAPRLVYLWRTSQPRIGRFRIFGRA